MNAPEEDRFSAELERLAQAAPPVPGMEQIRRRHHQQQRRRRTVTTACLLAGLAGLAAFFGRSTEQTAVDTASGPVVAEWPRQEEPAPDLPLSTPAQVSAAIQTLLAARLEGDLRVAKNRHGLVLYGDHAKLDDDDLDSLEALLDGVARFDAVFLPQGKARVRTFISKCI